MSRSLLLVCYPLLVIFLAMVGSCAGLRLGFTDFLQPKPAIIVQPLPHHLPRYPGGVSLRFAMVQDVLHERYPRHGSAYYTERNRRVREALTALPEGPRTQEEFSLLDDLGAGLELLGRHEEAVTVLRDKLRRQVQLARYDANLYTTYANLGTFLIHGNVRQAEQGDAEAKQRLREGLEYIRKSIQVNPQAHFGREVWQAVAVEYLLAVSEKPRLLLEYDLVGDRLTEDVDPRQRSSMRDRRMYGWGGVIRAADGTPQGEGYSWGDLERVREEYITPIGAAAGWTEAVPSAHQKPVPFDEPTLGIIGMWRLGGGANPHFALALGEIMLRVGQRYLAWSAYERAVRLADHVWPDPDIQRDFIDHCRRRQAFIEEQLPAEERSHLRPAFEAELQHGLDYQEAYQRYEKEQIAAGASISDPHFYDAFHATHGSIASPVGVEEQFVVKRRPAPDDRVLAALPTVVLCAGVFAFLAACLVPLPSRRKRAR